MLLWFAFALLLLLLAVIQVSFVLQENIDYPFLKNPQMQQGDEFLLKTPDGRFLTSCGNCYPGVNLDERCSRYLCVRKYPYQSSVFTFHKHRDGTCSIETVTGKFWKRCIRCGELCHDVICADGVNKKLQNSKFVLIKNANGTVSFKTDTGRILELCNCNDTAGCGKLVCSLGVGKETEFILEKLPKRFPDPVLQFIKFKPAFDDTGKVQRPPLGVLLSNLS